MMAPVKLLALCLVLIVGNAAAAPAAAPTSKVAATLTPSQPVAAGKPVTLSVSLSRLPERTVLPTSAFKVTHERLMHLVGVGSDLDTFMHWHPTATTPSAFTFADVTFPKAGTYLIALDAQLAEGSKDVATHTKLAVSGSPRMSTAAAATAAAGQSQSSSNNGITMEAGAAGAAGAPVSVTVRSTPLTKAQQPGVSLASLVVKSRSVVNGASSNNGGPPLYTATVAGPGGAACKPGKAATYVWTLYHGSSSSSAKPVTDLRMYYGAPMHLAVAKSDLSFIAHEHGDVVTPGSKPPNNNNKATKTSDEHAGHGRRLLQQAPGNNLNTAAANKDTTMTDSSMEHMGHSMMGMGGATGSKSSGFGPAIETKVTFPSVGRYLLVGQVSRGNDLILLPVHLSCSG